jgi:hypothetical protein
VRARAPANSFTGSKARAYTNAYEHARTAKVEQLTLPEFNLRCQNSAYCCTLQLLALPSEF